MYSVKGTITAVPSQISESWLYSPDYLTTMHILESALHVMRDIESRFRIREHRAIFAKKPGSRMKQAVTRSILVNCLRCVGHQVRIGQPLHRPPRPAAVDDRKMIPNAVGVIGTVAIINVVPYSQREPQSTLVCHCDYPVQSMQISLHRFWSDACRFHLWKLGKFKEPWIWWSKKAGRLVGKQQREIVEAIAHQVVEVNIPERLIEEAALEVCLLHGIHR